jgi:hypothetical protein
MKEKCDRCWTPLKNSKTIAVVPNKTWRLIFCGECAKDTGNSNLISRNPDFGVSVNEKKTM